MILSNILSQFFILKCFKKSLLLSIRVGGGGGVSICHSSQSATVQEDSRELGTRM